MAAFDHRRADASLRAHAIRFQAALRKQDEDALAELVLPKPPAWMLDPHATKRASVGRIKKGNYALPHQYGACLVTDIAVSFRPPWGTRDKVVVNDTAVSLDRGATWRFIDGMPDAGRVMGDPAYLGLMRHAARTTLVSPLFVTFGGGPVRFWAPRRSDHPTVLARMERLLPSAAARAKALAFMADLVRRYQGGAACESEDEPRRARAAAAGPP